MQAGERHGPVEGTEQSGIADDREPLSDPGSSSLLPVMP